ncbi:MAG: hypothetical protein ABIS18_04110 [Actinomycetota bacterium]
MTIRVVTVRVLAGDESVRDAATSLPQPRFDVDLYRDKKSFLAVSERGDCDVAVIDLQLGGFSAARDLRDLPEMSEALVVMLCEREQDRWLCKQGGADLVLVKPLQDVTTLMTALDSVLESTK